MNFYKKILILVSLMTYSIVSSQSNKLKKANSNFDNFAYAEAILKYKEIIDEGNGTIEIYKRLGDAYFYNSKLNDAATWYLKMFTEQKKGNSKGIEIENEYYFRTAQCLKYLKDYKKADSLLTRLVNIKKVNDSRLKELIKNPKYLDEIEYQSNRYTIKNLPKNSEYVDFAPALYKNRIIFSSSRSNSKKTKKNKWTQQSYLDLFEFYYNDSINSTEPTGFSKTINSRLHESTSVFTKDEYTVYFTRNNLLKTRYGKDSTGVNRLKIYRATLNDELIWTNIEDLSINNDQYSIAHPALSIDERKLYFVSDMPGGYGMSDIYVSNIAEDGTIGPPKNLGPEINTEGRDTFPYISSNGMLYFASDGHLGLGGLDIFVTDLYDIKHVIYNVGEPINSSSDDITFIFDHDTKKGYFASNRPGGKGGDDIYSFVENSPLIKKCSDTITINVVNGRSGNIINDAKVEIKNDRGTIVYRGKTNQQGYFSTPVDCRKNKIYIVIVQKTGFDSALETVTISNSTEEESLNTKTIAINKQAPKKGIDLASLLNLKPIYFASNKVLVIGNTSKELDKVISYMKEHPSISIEIGSHTDSRGSDAYNMELSTGRANATANYIIRRGIDSTRVKSKGYGETVLINRCGNDVPCSKEEHAKNRRSEFIVIDN